MGIFDFFVKLSPETENRPQIKDERKPECPYCHKTLEKIPGKKTQCPHCGEFMFVRTRPKDNARVVVTKQEADKIEEEWSIVSGTHDYFIAEKEKFEKERESLKNRFGKEPLENDVKWGLLNKELIEHAQNMDWGLYRNARFNMAEILRKEMNLKQALIAYLEVCFIDLNGPNNAGHIKDNPELLKEFPPFDPNNFAFVAPGVIDIIKRIMKKLNFDKNSVKSSYLEHNFRVEKSLRLPLSAENSWKSLEKEIFKMG